MTTAKIPPALTSEEWAGYRKRGVLLGISTVDDVASLDDEDKAKAIAIANDSLKDDDRRKITREKVEAMRSAACFVPDYFSPDSVGDDIRDAVNALADALESYLPPEGA